MSQTIAVRMAAFAAAIILLIAACTPVSAPAGTSPAMTSTQNLSVRTPAAITDPTKTAPAFTPASSKTSIPKSTSNSPTSVSLSGALEAGSPEAGTPAATQPITGTIVPTQTIEALPSASVTGQPAIAGEVNAELLLMREGPSKLYRTLKGYPDGTELTILGKTSSGEWLQVKAPGGDTGWVAASFVDLPQPLAKIPSVNVPYSQTVAGTVKTSDGQPVDVSIAIVARGGSDLRTDVNSGQTGEFTAYLPPTSIGFWNVSVVGINCNNIVVDMNCDLTGFVVVPSRYLIELPLKDPLSFVFEATDLVLDGEISGSGVLNNLNIVAERSDGSASYGSSDHTGNFSIPIAPGEWDIYVIRDGVQGRRVHVQVAIGSNPAPVTLIAP